MGKALDGWIGLLLLSLLLGCGPNADTTQANEEAREYKTFAGGSADAYQVLQVNWQSDSIIRFVLEHRRTDGSCNFTLSGNAINLNQSADPQADTDETGELYWIDQYLYGLGSCRMAIRIAQDTNRVQLQIDNCQASPSCRLESLGVLRKEN